MVVKKAYADDAVSGCSHTGKLHTATPPFPDFLDAAFSIYHEEAHKVMEGRWGGV